MEGNNLFSNKLTPSDKQILEFLRINIRSPHPRVPIFFQFFLIIGGGSCRGVIYK